jgi:DNA end-binding protein Ku
MVDIDKDTAGRLFHARNICDFFAALIGRRPPLPRHVMPARSIGTATISFGLVSVPVNIYSSSESKTSVSFNMLHKKCGNRLKQQYICTKDNEIVTRDETVKGYEFAKDQYVVLSTEELKALEEKATGTIDVVEFVPLSGVDREYLEKVYYLGPDKGGDRAYRLLAAALKETGRAALGQYAARGQQHLVLLRPLNGVLVMEQLHYADELRPTTEVTIPAGDVKEAELKLAKQLIDQTSNEEFEPNKYKDTVRERMLETIQRKIDGQDITSDVAPGTETKMLDLMEALKASLSKEKPSKKEKAESKRMVS